MRRKKWERVFLDMDGVIADFETAYCNQLAIPSPYMDVVNHGHYGCFDYQQVLSVADNYDFWAYMPLMDDALQIYDFARWLSKDVAFLSYPMAKGGSMQGKLDWCTNHFPGTSLILATDGRKDWLASKDTWLIEDSQDNAVAFRKAGGRGVLVPRPWNALHKYAWDERLTMKCLEKTVQMYERGLL